MKVNFDQLIKPFWSSNIMYDESVLMVSKNGEPPSSKLLFYPNKINNVRMADYSREFFEGADWFVDNGRLKLTTNSKIPVMLEEELYPKEAIEGWSQLKVGGGNVLFHEEHFFHDQQLVVTYTHDADTWCGPIPKYAGQDMPVTINKLLEKEALKVVLFGDSISVGANASGVKGAPPYLPSWGKLFVMNLENTYGADITFKNPSVGGMTSEWGVEHVRPFVADEKPDLAIIAFGMNDGSANTDKYIFKSNIEKIINSIREHKPDSEVILVAPTVANPETFFAGCQQEYKEVLEELTETGIILADMTSMHMELLKHKKFRDMTGNNVNHPNDFLVRCHAQVLSTLLIP